MNLIDKLTWIVIENRKILFVRTKNKELFYTPGGKREGDESDEQALIREIKEELSVDLIPETIKYIETFTAQADGKLEGIIVEIKCYTAEHKGSFKPSNEIEELAWFGISDINRLSLVGQLILKYFKDQNLID